MNNLFGPLGRQYCLYFYYLSMIGFIFLVLAMVTTLYIGITKRKGGEFYMKMILVSLGYFFFYLQNRILFSMCSSSL